MLATLALAAACAPTLPATLAAAKDSRQLVTVVARDTVTTHATVTLWRRDARGCWVQHAGPWAGRLGRNGVSNRHREGDGTTPTGAYAFGDVVYGIAPNPGVRYRYHRIVCGDWWNEDSDSPGYNTFQHVSCGTRPAFGNLGEGLWRAKTAYRHFAVIEYNTAPVVPGRGSGIFLHVDHGRPTAGCVSLPLAQLVTTLRWLRPAASPRVVIGTTRGIRRY